MIQPREPIRIPAYGEPFDFGDGAAEWCSRLTAKLVEVTIDKDGRPITNSAGEPVRSWIVIVRHRR